MQLKSLNPIMKKTINIGIYDSGLGGLTVLKEFKKIMPYYHYIYFGDTAHVPYGNKSKQTIFEYSKEAIKFFEKQDVTVIIIACNTVSSLVLEELKEYTDIALVDVITPFKSFFKQKVEDCKENINIGVIGTNNTIQSKAYNKILTDINSKIQVYSQACPMFVPIIELGFVNHRIAPIVIEEYLHELKKEKLHYLILGCTHYPLLKHQILKHLPEDLIVVDSATITAKFTKKLYVNSSKVYQQHKEGTCEIYVSDEPNQFQRSAQTYFNFTIDNVQLI